MQNNVTLNSKKNLNNLKLLLFAIGFFLIEQIGQVCWMLTKSTTVNGFIAECSYLMIGIMIVYKINDLCQRNDQECNIQQRSWLQAFSLSFVGWIFIWINNLLVNNVLFLILRHLPSNDTIGTSNNQTAIQDMIHHTSSLKMMLTIFTIVIIAPWCEEFLFRVAIINQKVRSKNSLIYIVRILISIILFGLAHMMTQTSQLFGPHTPVFYTAWYQLGAYLAISMTLAFMYIRFKSYRVNIMTHMLWNAISVMIMFV